MKLTRKDKQSLKRWFAALRSGVYAQGRGQLCKGTREGDVFCCLGVLCDLDGGEWEEKGRMLFYQRDMSIPGPEVTKRMFGRSADVDMWALAYVELASMNDGGKSFGVIADKLEGFLK